MYVLVYVSPKIKPLNKSVSGLIAMAIMCINAKKNKQKKQTKNNLGAVDWIFTWTGMFSPFRYPMYKTLYSFKQSGV